MSEAFLKVVNMSISAGWLVLAVLALRFILKKAPKWVSVLLWGIVAIRLICPFSIESALSLIPSAETISPDIMLDRTPTVATGIPALNSALNPVISESFAPAPGASANPLQIWIPVLSIIWLIGIGLMLTYTAVSYLSLRRKLRMAVILRENIFQCETVHSPFVLGILKPRIYLPYTIDGKDRDHVVAHEQAHIRRFDHWWKPLGFLLLTIYWFNPLMWVAYILLCRDIELACDEKVIAELGNEQRAGYTQALVVCSINRRSIAACPLAFGEVGVKERVKSIMNYRKPTFWIMVTALVLCAVVAVCFLTNPNPSREFSMNGSNVSSLDPEAIVDRILDIEDIENSGIHTNSVNFGIYVDSDFNWMDSQTVRYFFNKDQKTYSAQLRIFPDDGTYFLTEPTEWVEQDRKFLLRHYLEAVKYLPQHAIQQMASADRYIIEQIDGGSPSDYDRVITYSADGVQELDSWFIHLQIQPLHAEGGAYHGTGEEVIELFYGAGTLAQETTVVNIIDRTVTEGLPTDEAIEPFFEDEAYIYSFPSIRSHLVMVTYSDGNSEDIKTALENGRATIDDLDSFGIQYYTEPKAIPMEPTETNLRGIVAGYLFVPIDGATYRYEWFDPAPEDVTADRLLDTFTEETQIEGIVWEVYSLKEYPDMTKLLLISGTNSAWLCEYAPAQQAEEGALEAARAAGYVIEEDGRLTDGKEAWEEFYEKTQRGEPASIHVARYYTLDPDRTAPGTYEAYRQDYPALYIHELEYDGMQFVLRTEEDVRVYEYLMKYTGTRIAISSSETDEYTHYVLTHSNTVTWEQLWNGLVSSASGAYIDHYTVCTELY